ncbi:MAG: Pyridoxamine 5-phosphate oxidase [Nocardioides sp.]|nr:Pyridoxamine 5-phosphate oxidase [Nocardioides sp.]
MTTSHHTTSGTLRELDEAQCWQYLAGRQVGQLAYVDRDGPIILPLNYVAHDGAVWLRTASYNHLAVHLPGQRVAFEVGLYDERDHSGWSVLLRGRAEHVLVRDLTAPPGWLDAAPWPDGTRSMVFRLTPSDVTGRLLRPRDVVPDAAHRPGTVQRHATGQPSPAPHG